MQMCRDGDDQSSTPDTCAAIVKATGARCRRRGVPSERGPALCGVHRRAATRYAECGICLDDVAIRRAYPLTACAHVFHRRCLRTWFSRGPVVCPMCRRVCLEGLGRLGTVRSKVLALDATMPAPRGAFFPTHMRALLSDPKVREALGLRAATLDVLIDLTYGCFTRDAFFRHVASLGLRDP